jgi:hypothetical protein
MLGYFAQLGSPNSSECLAGRSPNQQINRLIDRPDVQFFGEGLRRQFRYVARASMPRIAGMEVGSVGGCSVLVKFDRGRDLETAGVEAERQPTATREEI